MLGYYPALENIKPLAAVEGLPSPLSSSHSMETRKRAGPQCKYVDGCRPAPHPPGMGFLQSCTQSLPGVINDTSSMAREVHGHQGVI